MLPVTGFSQSPGLSVMEPRPRKPSALARADTEAYAPVDRSLGQQNRPVCTGFVAPSRVQGTPIGGRRRQVSAPIKNTKDLQTRKGVIRVQQGNDPMSSRCADRCRRDVRKPRRRLVRGRLNHSVRHQVRRSRAGNGPRAFVANTPSRGSSLRDIPSRIALAARSCGTEV